MDALRDNVDLGEQKQYIVVKISDERYGIDIKHIDNIVRMQSFTRVPKMEKYLKGVINIRGEIVPVISLRVRMGIEEDEITADTSIIILRLEGDELVGIIVDAVDRVMTLHMKDIEQMTRREREARENGNFISGVGKHPSGLVSILDLSTLSLDTEKKNGKEKKEMVSG